MSETARRTRQGGKKGPHAKTQRREALEGSDHWRDGEFAVTTIVLELDLVLADGAHLQGPFWSARASTRVLLMRKDLVMGLRAY